MKIDLSPYIDKEIAIVRDRLNLIPKSIWMITGLNKLSYTGYPCWPTLLLKPRILHYSEKGIRVAVPWLGIQVVDLRFKIDTSAQVVINNLKLIELCPFIDENALMSCFTYPKKVEPCNLVDISLVEIECYVNIHYPEGYQENNIL